MFSLGRNRRNENAAVNFPRLQQLVCDGWEFETTQLHAGTRGRRVVTGIEVKAGGRAGKFFLPEISDVMENKLIGQCRDEQEEILFLSLAGAAKESKIGDELFGNMDEDCLVLILGGPNSSLVSILNPKWVHKVASWVKGIE